MQTNGRGDEAATLCLGTRSVLSMPPIHTTLSRSLNCHVYDSFACYALVPVLLSTYKPYWEDEKDWLGIVGGFVCCYYCVDLFSSMASIHSWRVRSSRSGLPSCRRSS